MDVNLEKAKQLAQHLGEAVKIYDHMDTKKIRATGYIHGVVFSNGSWCIQYQENSFYTVDVKYVELIE